MAIDSESLKQNRETQLMILKMHHEQQGKYTYYLIALCVSTVGYSIYLTFDKPLMFSQIPLGLAILSWTGSIICGLLFLDYELKHLYYEHDLLDIAQGKFPKVGDDPEKIKVAVVQVRRVLEDGIDTASKLGKWQIMLLLFGAILFLLWHILEMYIKTIHH